MSLNIPESVSLDCKVDAPQATKERCWDDCARAFSKYVGGKQVSQGELANFRTGRKDCTNSPVPEQCVVASTNDQIIAVYDYLGVDRVGPDLRLSEYTAVQELIAKRPFEPELAWASGGGHVIIVNGYKVVGVMQNVPQILFSISDPFYGEGWATYQFLRTAYGQGEWVRTFGRFTKKGTK